MTIDLGKSPEPKNEVAKATKAPYYPTLYVSEVQGLDDLPTGEFTFTGKGKVLTKTEKQSTDGTSYSCEIEVHSISPQGGSKKKAAKADAADSLGAALDTIAKKKVTPVQDDSEDAADMGADEDTETE